MAWFLRKKKNILTPSEDRKNLPKGLWYKTPSGEIIDTQELKKNLYVSLEDGYHVKIGSREYFDIFFDEGEFEEFDTDLSSEDPLKWIDSKKYSERLQEAKKKTGLKEALRSAFGKLDGRTIVIACMDFTFIGGSMGSAVGEKIKRAIEKAIKKKCPFLLISKSGGARMMEAPYSLMQMAKTVAMLSRLSQAKLPYISLLTDPTTGGVTASYALLGDINISEPGALIGFAGPRVIKETIGKDLPVGFQTAEFLLEHGFIDIICNRNELKKSISEFISMTSK
ncbi:acetyl-CoA carboxylase, carboxyltransferase subunit beta [Bacteroidetes bacterium endosymbiont of Geopemphigus sp.]|uniref:acetyl-CoA carboxylase, carboxyltransferase subunit beta n=1 Tax=Bacteroidetes bacterium endosymbiont of Geopemphigus sp. TaxID=2047937 RepID=UPI000CD10DF4|nr:acetyl-CoA carboxylase, carboxyltransferase subunit beta [Bacteroidetes bacterium endosymbiont of Geopemphigus sp.]